MPFRSAIPYGVSDRDQQLTILAQFQFYRKFTGGLAHRLNAIEHRVQEHLLPLHAICPNFGKFGAEVRAHAN